MKCPLVSVCIPAYNSENYIRETLNSILNQTYPNLEVVIVDDGSHDRTISIVNSFDDRRISVFKQENKGAGAARNKAFLHSTGSFIKFMDADDLLHPESISSQIKLAIENPNSLISGKWGRFYNGDIKTFKYAYESVWKNMAADEWIIESWSNGCNMTQPGIFLLSRTLIENYGLWIEDLSKGPNDDMEFYTRMILSSMSVIFCSESCLYYRSGIEGSLSKKKDRVGYETAYQTIDLSTKHLLKINNSSLAKKAAAVQFKMFIYDCYPLHKDLFKKAENNIIELGGLDFHHQFGGITKLLSTFIGWKLAKKTKLFYKSLRIKVSI